MVCCDFNREFRAHNSAVPSRLYRFGRSEKTHENQVTQPGQSVFLADGAGVANPTQTNPDLWQEVPGTGCSYFRVPSDPEGYPTGDSRSVPRHSKRVNIASFDGHAERIRNSSIRYDLPRTDGASEWAKNHDGTQP